MGITIKVNRSAGPKKLLPCPLVPCPITSAMRTTPVSFLAFASFLVYKTLHHFCIERESVGANCRSTHRPIPREVEPW